MSFDKFKLKLEAGQLLTERELNLLAERAINVLIQEPNVVEVQAPQYLIGDVHGQYYDFLKMLKEVSTSCFRQFLLTVDACSWEIMLIEAITPSKQSATCSS